MHSLSHSTGIRICALMMLLTACAKTDKERADSAATAEGAAMMQPETDSGSMGGISGQPPRSGTDRMPTMTGMSGTSGMSAEMIAHMSEMKAADGATMKTMLPAHRKMVTGMLSQMNEQMTQMKGSTTPAWTALSDSIRSDLTAMAGMGASALAAMVPAHEVRIAKLSTMHDGMMKGMK